MRTKLLVASAMASMLLLAFAAVYSSDDPKVSYLPKDGELVAIRSVRNGKYLEVSPRYGRLRAAAASPSNRTALFRVMVLSRPMVDMLADAMRTTNVAKWSHRKMSTKSSCKCSGFSAPPSAASSRRPPPSPSRGLSRV